MTPSSPLWFRALEPFERPPVAFAVAARFHSAVSSPRQSYTDDDDDDDDDDDGLCVSTGTALPEAPRGDIIGLQFGMDVPGGERLLYMCNTVVCRNPCGLCSIPPKHGTRNTSGLPREHLSVPIVFVNSKCHPSCMLFL